MAPGVLTGDSNVGGDSVRQKSKATPDTIIVGCIAVVQKDGQPRRAEILSIKDTKSGRQFYCNFDSFNKRLDEWVPATRVDFDQEVEWPSPEKDKSADKSKKVSKKSAVSKKNQKKQPGKREQSVASESATPQPWTDASESQPQSKAASQAGDDDVEMGDEENTREFEIFPKYSLASGSCSLGISHHTPRSSHKKMSFTSASFVSATSET